MIFSPVLSSSCSSSSSIVPRLSSILLSTPAIVPTIVFKKIAQRAFGQKCFWFWWERCFHHHLKCTVTHSSAVYKQSYRKFGNLPAFLFSLFSWTYFLVAINHLLLPKSLTTTLCNDTSLNLDHLLTGEFSGKEADGLRDVSLEAARVGLVWRLPPLPLAPPNSLPWQAKRPPLPTCLLPPCILPPTCPAASKKDSG